MSFNAFVVNEGAPTPSPSLSFSCSGTKLAWSNKLADNPAFSENESSTTEQGEFNQVFDYTTTSRFNTFVAPSATIVFKKSTHNVALPKPYPEDSFNYIALADVNWRTAGIIDIDFKYEQYNSGTDSYDIVDIGAVNVSEFSDFQPLMIAFDEINTSSIIISMNVAGSLIIGLWYAGKTLDFPVTPDGGFTPGKWNNANNEKAKRISSNAFGSSPLTNDGTEEDYKFSSLPVSFLDTEYRSFIKSFRFHPVFSMWSPQSFQSDVIFGRIKIEKTIYKNGITGATGFKIRGIV